MELSDEVLCGRVAGGDDAAFETLVARYRERAWRVAWRVLRDPEDAREVCQEAFLRVHRTAGTFRGQARFSTWFHRILVNLCFDHQRRHRWWRRLLAGGGSHPVSGNGIPALERQPALDPGPDAGVLRTATMTELWRAIEKLSPQRRAAIVLQLEGLPTRDIAAALGCAEATVRVHTHRALATLRQTMER